MKQGKIRTNTNDDTLPDLAPFIDWRLSQEQPMLRVPSGAPVERSLSEKLCG